MKFSKEEIAKMKKLTYKCGAALDLIEQGYNVEYYGRLYAKSFAELGEMLHQKMGTNNARIIGDLVVDKDGIFSPLNTQS